MNKTTIRVIISPLVIILLIPCLGFAQSWTQVGSDIDGEYATDYSGFEVSLSSDGSRVAIAAQKNDEAGIDAGHVRMYSESGGVWTQVGSDIDGEAEGDMSGKSLSLSSDGTRVAIGADRNDGTDTDAGHVRVYSESGGVWTQVGSDIDGEAAYDYSGNGVSLSSDGSRVAIGASGNDGAGNVAGHVRVYSESGGVWTQVGSDIDGESAGDQSGNGVSLSSDGGRVAIGARGADSQGRSGAGHVRVFSESGGIWTQVGSDIDGEAAYDESGFSISLSSDGTRIAIGATENDGAGSGAGHVRMYSESEGVWTQVGSDIDGEAAGDWSGWTVSLSSDGSMVAIGACRNDGMGISAGHVRVYSESEGVWTQVGSDIDGEAAGDESGNSLSLSSDGTRVAIGARWNDGTGFNAGHVRVYSISFPQKGTGDLIVQVDELLAGDVLNDGQCNSLISQLEGVLAKLDKDKTSAAINQLQAFINHVNNFISDRILTLSEGQPLIDAADYIITQLQDSLIKQNITEDSVGELALQKVYALEQNYPNPFNPATTINYNLPDATQVTIVVYDLMGRAVRTLVNRVEKAGYKSVIWDSMDSYGQPVSGGIYILNIQAGKFSQTKKMVLLR